MTIVDHPVRAASTAVKKVPDAAAAHDEQRDRLVDGLGMVGWFTRGCVYLVVAGILVKVAWSGGAEPQQPTRTGVLYTLSDRSGGLVLIGLLGVGAVAYVLVRLAPLVLYRRSTSWQQRGQALVAAAIYLPLGLSAFHLLRGDELRSGLGGDEGETNEIGAGLLQHSWGVVILVGAAVGFCGYGGYQIYKGIRGSFLDKLELESSALSRRLVRVLGTIGFVARGVIAIMLGGFIGWAAAADDSSSVHSINGALRQFVGSPVGTLLLTTVALGLAGFAGYCFCAATTRPHHEG